MLFFKKKEEQELILNKIMSKDRLKQYFFLVIGCFLLAIAFNVFFSPNNLVTGGVSGIAIVVRKLTGLPTKYFIGVCYILLLLISYITLGREVTKNSLIGSILYPIFIVLTENVGNYINFDVDNMLLIAVFGGIINGIGSGLTFKYGFSTGGSDIVCQLMSKYFKISIGQAIKILNYIIIIGAGFFIGTKPGVYAFSNVMYAIIVIYIVSMLNDKLLLGVSDSKSFYIITDHETSIKSFLINELKLGVTILEGRGGYTGDRKKVLLCVIPTKEYFLAKEGILTIDKDAIIMINDVYQSTGIE